MKNLQQRYTDGKIDLKEEIVFCDSLIMITAFDKKGKRVGRAFLTKHVAESHMWAYECTSCDGFRAGLLDSPDYSWVCPECGGSPKKTPVESRQNIYYVLADIAVFNQSNRRHGIGDSIMGLVTQLYSPVYTNHTNSSTAGKCLCSKHGFRKVTVGDDKKETYLVYIKEEHYGPKENCGEEGMSDNAGEDTGKGGDS